MAATACPNCGAHIDPSAFPPGDAHDLLRVWENLRRRRPASRRSRKRGPEPERVYELPASPPVPRVNPEPPPPRLRRRAPEDEPATGRWLAFAVCLLLLLVVLGGIGYMVWQAHSEGGSRFGPTTALPRPQNWQPPPPGDAP